MKLRQFNSGALLIFLSLLIFTSNAFSQAWVPPKSVGSFAISYVNNYDDGDFLDHGEHYVIDGASGFATKDFGRVRTQGVYFDFGYSFTNRLAITASLPYLAAKYDAPRDPFSAIFAAHKFSDGSIPADDGKYHGTFQDFAFRLRYNITAKPFLITPFVEYNQPSHGYLFFSHAVVGRNVRSVGFGTYLGGTFDRWIPNLYMQGRYSIDFDEKILTYSRYRHVMEMEAGYFLTPAIRAFGVLAGQVTHGGINILSGTPAFAVDNTDPIFFHHGQITRDNDLIFGLGGQYSLNNSFDLYGLVQHMVTARNLHAQKYGLTFGFSWGFGGSPQRPCHC